MTFAKLGISPVRYYLFEQGLVNPQVFFLYIHTFLKVDAPLSNPDPVVSVDLLYDNERHWKNTNTWLIPMLSFKVQIHIRIYIFKWAKLMLFFRCLFVFLHVHSCIGTYICIFPTWFLHLLQTRLSATKMIWLHLK